MKPVDKETKKAFFKNHKKEERPEKDEEEPAKPDAQSKTELLNSFYKIKNPIPTCVGPIGEFEATPDAFPNHPSVGLFGKRRTGKSYTLRCLLYNCFRDVPFGLLNFFDFFQVCFCLIGNL